MPRLVAVSKKQPVEKVTWAYRQGVRHFGENYVSLHNHTYHVCLIMVLCLCVYMTYMANQVQQLLSKAKHMEVCTY